jgi:hypothetical protein
MCLRGWSKQRRPKVASKKTVSISFPDLKSVKGLNPKVKIAIAFVTAVILLSISYSAGNSAGYTTGYAEGDAVGYDRGYEVGDKAGFGRGMERVKAEYDNGYNDGRVDGCEWLITSLGESYVIGLSNPFTTWYYLMGIGDTYANKGNCAIDGSGGYHEPSVDASSASN